MFLQYTVDDGTLHGLTGLTSLKSIGISTPSRSLRLR